MLPSVSGKMRICQAKSVLKNKSKVNIFLSSATTCNCFILDGCAYLWVTPWPTSSPINHPVVADYVYSFMNCVQQKLRYGDVYLVFDRYITNSTKTATRETRGTHGFKVFHLSSTCPLPPQKQVLGVSENKQQLIKIIVEMLVTSIKFPDGCSNKLIVTGQDSTPTEISPGGIVIQRRDLMTTHEEGDAIVVQQAIYAASVENKIVQVCADDTDIYVILLYHYRLQALQKHMQMVATHGQVTVIDIEATAKQLGDKVLDMLPAHALTGCDQVAMCHGIGKGKMLKSLLAGNSLSLLGELTADFEDVLNQATKFICACYGISGAVSTMTEARITTWLKKMARTSLTKTPALNSLPPTTGAFAQNVKRAHLQTAIWKQALKQDPPDVQVSDYGWEVKDGQDGSIEPVAIPGGEAPAPDYVLKLIACKCESTTPCRTNLCSCVAANMTCTAFCHLQNSMACSNDSQS